jgi:3-hydroxyacyl-CoA dehydrogenase/enoyl-CoA hydratase/3-hydroxybutyryl-CoA epimerase
MFEGLRFNHWKTSVGEDGIVLLALDRADSKVNAISRAVLDELAQIVERLAIEEPAGVIIHSRKPSGLAVGADITEFADYARQGSVLENIEHGQHVFESLARLRCPSVGAIHGACLGGGMELMLACRQRIAVDEDSTRIGLPEVMLGIHPGWGGTARLPRLIGATQALPLLLAGKTLSARRALALGVVDRHAGRWRWAWSIVWRGPMTCLPMPGSCCVIRTCGHWRAALAHGRTIPGWRARSWRR